MNNDWSCVLLCAVHIIVTLVSTATIDMEPSPVAMVTEGSVLWLTCTYDMTGDTLGQLQWLGNDGGGVATVTPTSVSPCEVQVTGYNIDCDNLASSEVRLGIQSPVHGDTYSCRVFLTDSTVIGPVSTQVSVVVPVTSVTFTPPVTDTMTVTPGGSQVYTCVTGSCRPPARIDWYKDDVNVTTQTGSVSSTGDKFVTTSSLTLTGSKGDTAATVQCRASNVDGMPPVVSADKAFVVEWPPDGPPVISGYTQTTILYPNDTVTLQCRQPGGNPLATLTWSGVCGGIPTTNSNTATEAVSDITITVTKGDNQATCSCVSTHPRQSQDTTQVTFIVHYPPSTPVITQTPTQPWLSGESGTLRCQYTEGFPTLTRIEWFRDGLQTGQSTPSITLGPLSHTDNRAGYSCRVHNAFTDVKHTDLTSVITHLNVEYKPLVTLTPTHLTVVEGRKAEVTCEATGHPKPTIQWLRGGRSLLSGQDTILTLTLEDVDRSATANYICRAESMSAVPGRQLFTERNVTLLVQYPPVMSVAVPLTVKEGDTDARVMCQTTGEPNTLVSQSWTQTIDQYFITDQFTYETAAHDTIFLSEVSLEDTGTYTCSVSNGIADRQGQTLQSNSTVLNVIVAAKFDISGQNQEFFGQLYKPLTVKIPFYSNPPVRLVADLEWTQLANGNHIKTSGDTTFNLQNDNPIDLSIKGRTVMFSGQAAVMSIRAFDQSFRGNYTITVYNDGRSRHSTTSFLISPFGFPNKPINFRVTDYTSSSITVKWTKDFNGGYPQTFVIIYGIVGGSYTQSVSVSEQELSTYSKTITNLKPDTRYQLNMYAYNDVGNSSLSSGFAIIGKTHPNCLAELQLTTASPNTASIVLFVMASLMVVVISTVLIVCVIYRRKQTGKSTYDDGNDAVKSDEDRFQIPTREHMNPNEGSHYDELNLRDREPQSNYEHIEGEKTDGIDANVPNSDRLMYESLGARNNVAVYEKLKGSSHRVYENTEVK